MRALTLFFGLVSAAGQAVTVPVDLGVGPGGYWFFGPLTANRGAVPHFSLEFNLEAVLDRQWLEENVEQIPARYRSAAQRTNEVRIGPSIFIPSTLYISPPIDALGAVGMVGVTWKPLGLTLLTTAGPERTRARLDLDAHLLLTYAFVFSLSQNAPVPSTHFLRPGIELRASGQVGLTNSVLLSLGGGAQVYLPQRMGSFIELGPLDEAMWLTVFAFLKVHVRFPYEASL